MPSVSGFKTGLRCLNQGLVKVLNKKNENERIITDHWFLVFGFELIKDRQKKKTSFL